MKLKLPMVNIIFGGFAVIAGVFVAIFGPSLFICGPKATGVIVTVFSILAGFLIAVMTLLGDQSIIPGSWRISEKQRTIIKGKLIRQKWLFYLYLATLAMIFINSLIKPRYPEVVSWIERIYFGLATTAFIFSFRLPAILMGVQMDRVDAVVEARKGSSSKIDRN